MSYCAGLFYRFYDGGSEGFVYPVILLHGAGTTHISWPPDLRRIAAHNIYAIDLPGHGKSNGPACRSMGTMTRRLHEFITQMRFFHVVLVGFSLGGALALDYARTHPARIKGIISISCGNRFSLPEGIFSFLRSPEDTDKVVSIFNLAAFHPHTSHSTRREILEPISKIQPGVLSADFQLSKNFRYQASGESANFPVTIIGGSDDLITPPLSLRQLNQLIPGSSLKIIPNAGHMVVFEKTRRVRELAVNFLDSVSKAG